MIQRISFEQAHDILLHQPDAVLIDVREEPEYLTGHAVDAQLLPVDEITEESAGMIIPDKHSTVLVYCRTGRRSARAAKMLESLGYESIYDMGGLVGWPYGLV